MKISDIFVYKDINHTIIILGKQLIPISLWNCLFSRIEPHAIGLVYKQVC